jgi:hypothetical protein
VSACPVPLAGSDRSGEAAPVPGAAPRSVRPEEAVVKYMLLIYSSPATWNALSQEERDHMVRDHAELYEELVASGEWVGGNILADPSRSRGVRVRDGVTRATDGPYAEVKEHLAGYDIVDCETPERALEIAARIPDARVCGVEVRPILDPGGLEM